MRGFAAGLVVGALTWWAPEAAQACSCVGTTQLGQRGTLPENAAVLLRDLCGGAENVTVTVDGTPAQLVEGALESVTPYGRFAWVEPAPAIGQTVEITPENPFGGEPESYAVVVGAADTTPPSLSVPMVALSEPSADAFCGDGAFAEYQLDVVVDDAAADEGTIYVFEVFVDGVSAVTLERSAASEGSVALSYLLEAATDEVCVEVSAVDAAGNVDEGDRGCASLSEAEAEADGDAGGCQCSAGGSGWAAAPLLLLALGAVRRRTPSSPSR